MNGVIQKYKVSKNLWGGTTETNKYIDGEGNTGTASNGDIFDQKGITVVTSTNYTFSWSNVVLGSDDNTPYIRICFYTSNGGTFISRILVTPSSYLDKYVTFTIPNNCTYVDIRIDSETSTRGQHFENLMLNVGSTALPYEPFETENLFDKDNSSMRYYGYINSVTGEVTPSASNSLSIIVPVKPNSNYTISKLATTRFRVGLFTNYPVAGSIATAIYGDRDGSGLDHGTTLSFSTSTNTAYIMAFIRNYDDTVPENKVMQSVMVNEGSTALPHTPYGTIWKDTPYTRLELATDIITDLPKTIYTDTTSIPSANWLNPKSTVEVNGNTHHGQIFPAGNYYIKDTNQFGSVVYRDMDTQNNIILMNGGEATVASSGDLLVYTPIAWAEYMTRVIVAKSSEAVPFTPYVGDYTIKGNMHQSGTPTPSSPVDVNGVGERTENIYDKTNVITLNIGDRYGIYCPKDTYSIYNDTDNTILWFVNNGSGRFEACAPHSTATVQMVGSYNNYGFFMPYNDASLGDVTIVKGSIAPDHYIPYGYKIPISSGGVTTNIYLGSAQTARVIGKRTFNGSENWGLHGTLNNLFYIDDYQDGYSDNTETGFAISNAFTQRAYIYVAGLSNGQFVYGTPSGAATKRILMKNTNCATKEDWTTYLAQQYANGTPVTVWYVLATPQTAAVNEPLMKIGDYVDIVSNPVQIPVTSGGQTFDVDTTLKPSEVDLTYHGWHEHEAEKYSRTENLFDGVIEQGSITNDGNMDSELRVRSKNYISTSGLQYTISATGNANKVLVFRYDENKNVLSNSSWENIPYSSPSDLNTKYIRITFKNVVDGIDQNISPADVSNVMVNTGSTALPYQPYLDWK